MARHAVDITPAEPVAASVQEVTPDTIVNAEAAQGEVVQLTGPEVIFTRLDAQTREVLLAMDAISPKGFVRGYEDPEFARGMVHIKGTKEGEFTWLGRWFQKVGITYHPVGFKKLPQGAILSQIHQPRTRKNQDGTTMKDDQGRTVMAEDRILVAFESTEQEQAFTKLCAVLPEYFLAMGII